MLKIDIANVMNICTWNKYQVKQIQLENHYRSFLLLIHWPVFRHISRLIHNSKFAFLKKLSNIHDLLSELVLLVV